MSHCKINGSAEYSEGKGHGNVACLTGPRFKKKNNFGMLHLP